MLAVPSEPFDSPEYLFEVKWNGIRALAATEGGQWQLWGRDLADYRGRYPELEGLRRLPAGTVLDGELVLLPRGLPDLDALLARHHRVGPAAIEQLGQSQPVTYVVFDVLAAGGHDLFGQPLQRRRAILQELLADLQEPRVVFSEGVRGKGKAFFTQAVAQGQEGVMAKHVASRYQPGRRSAAWKKIKPARSVACVVIGFVPGRYGMRRLLVAAPDNGRLRYVATLSTGFTASDRVHIQSCLNRCLRPQPVVACSRKAVWVEPAWFCQVRFLEWTPAGYLRGASFHRWLENSASLSESSPTSGPSHGSASPLQQRRSAADRR
jgi:ATP-dependent DNA ligase